MPNPLARSATSLPIRPRPTTPSVLSHNSTPSQRLRAENANRNRKRPPRDSYDTNTYAKAVKRGCEKAGVEPWSPNQLRHAKATELRREFGIEAAQVTLGHSSPRTTEIYAERDLKAARDIARKTG